MMDRRDFVGAAAMFLSWGPVSRLLAHSGGSRVDSAGVWTCRTIQTVARENVNQPPVVTGISIQPAGKWLAVVGDDHTVSLLDMNSLEFVSQFSRHRDWVRSVKFSPDGKYLATAGNDARLLIWDMESPGQVRELASHPQAIIKLDISPDGRLIATVGFDNQLRVYDVLNGRREWSAEAPCGDMNAVAFSADGASIAAGGRTGIIRIWDSRTGEMQTEFQAQRTRVRSIEYAADGQIISCGNDCAIKISDPSHPELTRTLARHDGKLFALKLMPQNRLATGGSDDAIHIWDLTALEPLETLTGHAGTVSCLDGLGSLLVSGSYDTQIRIWESQQRAELPNTDRTAGLPWSPKARTD